MSFPPRPAPAITLPCLALFHPAPHSFTTQDVLELQAPANPALLERILQTLLAALREHTGAGRLAEPGEFTQRAFTAGRIDLTRAEGVAATISAVCDAQLQAARLLRTGRLGSWSTDLVDQLAQLLALVEAGIDFVDQDDVVPITPAALDDGLSAIERQLEQLLHRSRSWSTLESLPWVVLVGPPNAGKSTLFNALLGHPRAVTSNIPGTTRDILTEPLRIPDPKNPHQSAEVMLVDVAGLDQPSSLSHLPSPNRKSKIENRKSPHPPSPISHPPISDALDDAMQSAAQDAIHRADLILQLQTDPPPPNRQSPIANRKSPSPIPILHLQTKSDLHPPATRTPANPADLHVSAVTGEGLGELRRRIADALSDRAVTLSGQMLALQPRHHDELHASLQATREARAMLTHQRDRHALLDMELIAGHMRRALDHLGALGGQMTPDDVIGKVFSTFCIGK